MLRLPPCRELGHVRVYRRDLEVVGLRPRLEQDARALVGRERRIALAVVAADACDQVERLDRAVDVPERLEQLDRLIGEAQRLDVGVDVHRALRGLPRVLRGLVWDVAEQVVVREGGVEVADVVREHVLDRQRHAPVQLGPPAHQQGVVRDLLRDRVLEAVTPLAALARGALGDEVRRDEDVDRISKPIPAGRPQHAIAEALTDHGRELDAFLRERG